MIFPRLYPSAQEIMYSKQQGKNIAADSSSDQSPIGFIAVWDEENTKLPPDYNFGRLKESIDLAMKHYDPRYQVDEFISYGPRKPCGIEFYGIKFHNINRENVRCLGVLKSDWCFEFVVNDENNNKGRKFYFSIFKLSFKFSIGLWEI